MRLLRIALALTVLAAGAARAAPPDPAASVTAGQVSAPRSTAVGADQIAAPQAGVTSEQQLSRTLAPVDAPSGGSTPGRGRDTTVARIGGHDHCDPATPGADKSPECARILEQNADAFAQSQPVAPAPVDTNANATGLVDSIVNGGTGSVVTLPPAKPQSDPHS
jgi:hypothetical protein